MATRHGARRVLSILSAAAFVTALILGMSAERCGDGPLLRFRGDFHNAPPTVRNPR